MAKKTFPHAVIIGGKLIPANTPVEVKKADSNKPEKDESAEDKKPE